MGIGDWGLGIGDWGLGIGPIPKSPIPNPQSPSPIPNKIYLYKKKYLYAFFILKIYNKKRFNIIINNYFNLRVDSPG